MGAEKWWVKTQEEGFPLLFVILTSASVHGERLGKHGKTWGLA